MKKILSIVTVLTMFIAVLILPTQAAAKTLFSDNFSSADLAAKWINPAIDNDPETVDKECEGVATVKTVHFIWKTIKIRFLFLYGSKRFTVAGLYAYHEGEAQFVQYRLAGRILP